MVQIKMLVYQVIQKLPKDIENSFKFMNNVIFITSCLHTHFVNVFYLPKQITTTFELYKKFLVETTRRHILVT